MTRHRMMVAALALATLACGSGTGPAGLTADRINGAWTFTLTRGTPCSASAVAGDVVARLDFQASGDVGNTVSTWSNERSVPDRYHLIGNIRLGSGQTELRFWQAVQVRGFLVTGTLARDQTFRGTAVDPIPGYQGYLSTGGCTYTVTGRRD